MASGYYWINYDTGRIKFDKGAFHSKLYSTRCNQFANFEDCKKAGIRVLKLKIDRDKKNLEHLINLTKIDAEKDRF